MTVDNGSYDSKQEVSYTAPSTSDPTDGDGGGNMDVWTTSRQNQMAQLVGINGKSYSDQSDFGLPAGVATGSYEITISNAEKWYTQPDLGVVAGDGGGTMDIWDQDRVTQLSSIWQIVPNGLTNESAYTIPAGVIGYGMDLNTAENLYGITTAGVEKGINVDDSITFEGTVFLAEDQENPDSAAVIAIDDANVYIEAEESEDLSNEITTNDDGSYTLPIPKRTETTTYFATITHEYFDEEFVHETEEGSLTEQRDWYLELPQFAGVPGRGASFGNPVIG